MNVPLRRRAEVDFRSLYKMNPTRQDLRNLIARDGLECVYTTLLEEMREQFRFLSTILGDVPIVCSPKTVVEPTPATKVVRRGRPPKVAAAAPVAPEPIVEPAAVPEPIALVVEPIATPAPKKVVRKVGRPPKIPPPYTTAPVSTAPVSTAPVSTASPKVPAEVPAVVPVVPVSTVPVSTASPKVPAEVPVPTEVPAVVPIPTEVPVPTVPVGLPATDAPKKPLMTKTAHNAAVAAKHAELTAKGIDGSAMLSEANLKKWITDEHWTYMKVARETGVPDVLVSALAKKYGIQSQTAVMIYMNKGNAKKKKETS